MAAVINNRHEVVNYLKDEHRAHVDITERTNEGKSVLELAIGSCFISEDIGESLKMLETLRGIGCDVNERTTDDPHLVTSMSGVSCHKTLDSRNAKATTKWLLNAGADVNVVLADGATTLWCAVDSVRRKIDISRLHILVNIIKSTQPTTSKGMRFALRQTSCVKDETQHVPKIGSQ